MVNGIGKPCLRLKAICAIYKISTGMIARGARGGMHRNYISNVWNMGYSPSPEKKRAIEEYLVSQGVPAELAASSWIEADCLEDEIRRLSSQAGIIVPEANLEEKLLNMGVCMLRRAVREHFQLHSDPFQPRIDDRPFKSQAFQTVFSAVRDALELRAFLGICGTTGSGKSVLWTTLNQELSRDPNVKVATVRRFDKDKILVSDIYRAIIEDLTGEVPRGFNRQERAHRRVETLLEANATAGINTVLLVNEAHDLHVQALVMLKRLWETFNDSPRLGFMRACTIILLGQERLESMLRADRPELREVAQRADLEHYGALAPAEVGPYLKHRFGREDGAFERIIDKSAVQAMGRGAIALTPQIVNVWASNALYTAYMVASPVVTEEHVGRVLQR